MDEAVELRATPLAGRMGKLAGSETRGHAAQSSRMESKRDSRIFAAEVADTGKPVSLASKIDIPRGATNFRAFADIIKTAGLESFRTETPDGSSR